MAEAKKQLEFLMAVVPADTPVTISSELKILEGLGIISNKYAVSAVRTASLLVSTDTVATFKGLMNLLIQLMEMDPRLTERHKEVLDSAIADTGQIDDFTLTFGTFLPICQQLMEAQGKRGKSSPR